MNRDDLESLIRRRLAQLPPPRAPETLVPRVMDQVRQRRRSPWYRQPWITWPRVWQVVSAALSMGLGAAVWFLLEGTDGGSVADLAGTLPAVIEAEAGAAEALAGGVRVVRRLVLEPIAGYLVAAAGVASMTIALAGAALNRLLGNMVREGSLGR